MSSPANPSTDAGQLRQRHAAQPSTAGASPKSPQPDNSSAHNGPDPDPEPKSLKTLGRTPDGTTLLYFLPTSVKQSVFAVIFLVWRASYNLGIGLLLRAQSNDKKLIIWAQKWKLFVNPATGENPRPWLYRLLKRELEAKIPEDYQFEKAPLEYNTWLVFRRLVDLILMCDFVSYCLFAIACSRIPEGESALAGIGRWALGLVLIGFNIWVKLDAHRVVKDYAWYWGDFFYLVDQELTFDGVFEMAPIPCTRLAMPATMFAFLVYVENPHIDKTYNPPPPRKRGDPQTAVDTPEADQTSAEQKDAPSDFPSGPSSQTSPAPIHNLLGLNNVDLFRTTDFSTLLIVSYLIVVAVVTPDTPLIQLLFAFHATAWRLWYSVGLGAILSQQSANKTWTRHFLKFGENADEAWRQWKGMYHISQVMTYTSFIAACWKMYSFPSDWENGPALLKHVLGAVLVALHIWTAVSIHESLGEFGWFFGDFFFDQGARLTYKSIYRFLNNPERFLGTAGLWGAALITWNKTVFLLALSGHVCTFGFLHFVEKPHMRKIYGRGIRQEAGLTKFLRSSLPPPVKSYYSSVNRVVDGTSHFVEDFLESARPKLAAGVSTIVRDTTALFNNVPARLTLTKLSPDLAGFDPKDYSLEVRGESAVHSTLTERSTGKEATRARFPGELKTMILEYGAPIKVKWVAPANHSKKDWIGLYMVADNRSRDVTEVSSLGRWVPTTPGQFDSPSADKDILIHNQPMTGTTDVDLVGGEVVFEGDKLWWTRGVFEFRYHHDGNHNVMSISQPFEIQIGRFDEDDVEVDTKGMYEAAVQDSLLPLVKNCFDRDPDIAPNTPDEPFGSHVERDGKYAKRVVYAIQQMFGIEFAPAVVPVDGNVRKLAWRICNAKKALVSWLFFSPLFLWK
ncbi:phosphatidylethanolamine n-methyltransferase [Apiospora sp. TS-2023a]